MESWKRHIRNIFIPLLLPLAIAGCGGSSGLRGTSRSRGTVTGAITDLTGAPVAGARVAIGNNSTVSLINGTYTISGVTGGLHQVSASTVINGNNWTGQTTVQAYRNEIAGNANIILSQQSQQGKIGGTVIGPDGSPLAGALIFVQGPLSSTMIVTDNNGNYQTPGLPPNDPSTPYSVVASLAGYSNETQTANVTSQSVTPLSFALNVGYSGASLPAPASLSTQTWTYPNFISRAYGAAGDGVIRDIQYLIRKAKHLPNPPGGFPHKQITRATPLGSIIEVDLFWQYSASNMLFGYDVQREVGGIWNTIDLLRDPLATEYADVDPALTPDVTYSYRLARLDTVDFPQSGAEQPLSAAVSATPLSPLYLSSPMDSSFAGFTPTFVWSNLNRAAQYQVLVFDQFPSLQSSTDTVNGVMPIWPADLSNPGNSLVGAGTNSTVYDGPALQSGHVYYWLVVAYDSSNTELSVSPLYKFTP